jgi:HSP20 family protein
MRDDEDPFDEFFREIERMMNGMWEEETSADATGFGTDVHVTVHETDDEIRVVADLPGVEKDALTVQCDGERLTIRAATDRREFEERVRLPGRVEADSASATFNNGILEVSFDRAAAADIDFD